MKQSTLLSLKTFLNWRYEKDKSGRLTKVPYSSTTKRKTAASEKYREDWVEFDTANACAAEYDGIGFSFHHISGDLHMFGVDIDKTKIQSDWVQKIIEIFINAFIEESPSGAGIHIIGLADLTRIPKKLNSKGEMKLDPKYYVKNSKSNLECYISTLTSRYFTYTGKIIQDGQDVDQTDELLEFLDTYMLKDKIGVEGGLKVFPPTILSNEEIIRLLHTEKNSDKWGKIFDEGESGYYNGDESGADMGLMDKLAFYTRCSPEQMEELFGLSALGQRDKWRDREDYRERTIRKAIADCGEVYGGNYALMPGDFSDVGQAQVFAREYGENNLRFSEATGFISYNGAYWEECEPKAQGLAQELTDRQLDEARTAVSKATDNLIKYGIEEARNKTRKQATKGLEGNALSALLEWFKACDYRDFVVKARASKQINAALKEVRPMVLIDVSQLDSDPFLLNTPGGTYDLRQGMQGFRPHSPHDYITKCTGVSPSDDGMELWTQFLRDVFCRDNELIDYVQQLAGVCAVGKVFREEIIFSYGNGKNGKSSFWNPIVRAFGSYSGSLSANALTANCRHNVRPELAEMRGKRIVLAKELKEGQRLDEAVLKKITSTDPVDAEQKYKRPFTFIPTHTSVMYTNFLPKIGSRDAGTTRRLGVVPFNAKFEGGNDIKNYGDFLFENAGEAIMQWVIVGAEKVINNNFHIVQPECVRKATQSYIESFDWLSRFLDDCCCTEDVKAQVSSGELYLAYRNHCDKVNEAYKRSSQDFNASIIGAGFERVQPGGVKKPAFFQGLRLSASTSSARDDFLK